MSRLQSERPEAFIEESIFLLKKVIFVQLFWSLSSFVCLLTKKVRVSRKQPTNTEKTGGKCLWKNRFFKSFSDSEQKILNNYTKNTRMIYKTTFKVFRGTILDVSLEWRNFAQVFQSLSEFFGLSVWIFCQNFSKVQPTGAAELFDVSFGKKSNCLIVSGLWAKITVISQRIWHLAGSLKVHFLCPQRNFEKKNDKSNLYYHHLFWDFEGSFLWFW